MFSVYDGGYLLFYLQINGTQFCAIEILESKFIKGGGVEFLVKIKLTFYLNYSITLSFYFLYILNFNFKHLFGP